MRFSSTFFSFEMRKNGNVQIVRLAALRTFARSKRGAGECVGKRRLRRSE